MCLLSPCGPRNSYYSDVSIIILNTIEQNRDITLRDSDDKYRRMDTVLDDTPMIQQNADEHGNVRRIPRSSRKKNRGEDISSKKPPSPCWLGGEVP
ncbi:hypothetical protein ACTXT7_017104 [Hymenolepis weldensis]